MRAMPPAVAPGSLTIAMSVSLRAIISEPSALQTIPQVYSRVSFPLWPHRAPYHAMHRPCTGHAYY